MHHTVSATCKGEKCSCGRDAAHKVGEEIPFDCEQSRHNFTAYVCCDCFGRIMGSVAQRWCNSEQPTATEKAITITEEYKPFLNSLRLRMPQIAREEFRLAKEICLVRSMKMCGLTEYPPVTGDPAGERCSGDMVCEKCGQPYFAHPADWRIIGYGNVPFLNVLCDGRRVKL